MLCPNCESENRDDAKFCDECGFPLSGAIARAAGTVSPAAEPHNPDGAAALPREGMASDDRPGSGYEATAADSEEAAREALPVDILDPFAEDPWGESPEEPAAPASRADNPTQVIQSSDVLGDVGQNAQESGEDPFAGYSTSADGDFVFDEATSDAGGYRAVNGEWQSEFTMQMPRVGQAQAQASRDFRVSSGKPGSGARGPLIAVLGLIVGILAAAAITYALGIWGGVAVPDVTGMTESDARAALEEEGFTVRSTQVKSDDTEGLVLIMDPTGGSRAGEGSEVVIHISTARFVPEVVGKTEGDARGLLEESGYENVRYEKEKSEGEEGVVLSISPEAGTRAKSNAEITVKVSEAYRVPDISALDLAAAEGAIADSGLVPGVVYIDTDQYEDGTVLGTEPEAGTKADPESYVAINVVRRRGAELVSLTEAMFGQGETVTIGGVDYEIQSVDSVAYEGGDVVSFTVTGLPKTTFFGKTIYADEQVVSGQVAWSEDNEVISIS